LICGHSKTMLKCVDVFESYETNLPFIGDIDGKYRA